MLYDPYWKKWYPPFYVSYLDYYWSFAKMPGFIRMPDDPPPETEKYAKYPARMYEYLADEA